MQAVLALHQMHNVFIGATPRFYCRRGTGSNVLTIMGCPADGVPCDSYSFTGDDFTSIVSEVLVLHVMYTMCQKIDELKIVHAAALDY